MKIRSILLLCSALWLVGCPYYNTFYNAKKAFSAAERIRKERQQQQGDRLPDQAIRLYEQAIENAALILRDHPHSDLVDDALVLIGDAFLAQGQFPQAARKFQEVLTNYPESDLAPYCLFSLGKASLSAGDTLRADEALQNFLKAHPRSKWSPDAYLLLGNLSFTQKHYELAITRYTDFLTSYPKHKQRGQAQYYIAESYLELNRHSEALALFERVSRSANTNELEFQANYMVGECLRRDQEYEPALKKFNTLLGKGSYLKYRPKIMLALAACHEALDQFDESITQYEAIIERYDRNQTYGAEVSQAMFELGIIHERQGALARAEELYLEARRRSPTIFWVRDEADRKSQDIKELQKYREDLNEALLALFPPDSLQSTSEPVDSVQTDAAVAPTAPLSNVIDARFRLAEHYLFRFNMVDSALVQYRLIGEEAQDENLAAKAAYARAWIIDQVVKDSVASATEYQKILTNYGHTPYGSEAARTLSLPDPNGPSDMSIFQQAEALLFEAEQPDSALHLYSMVVERYPESNYVPQALFAMGWITETHQENPDSALQIYRQLDTLYPRSDQAEAVSSKIRFMEEALLAEASMEDSTIGVANLSDMPETETPDLVMVPLKRHGDVVTVNDRQVQIRMTTSIPVEVGDTGALYALDSEQHLTHKLASFHILTLPNANQATTATAIASQNRIQTLGKPLRLRSGPDGEVIGALPHETPVAVLQEDGIWLQVQSINGETGFVRSRFVARSGALVGTDKWQVATSGSYLTLRDGPDGAKIGSLTNGTPVEMLDVQNGWSHVKAQSQEGYVSSRFLKWEVGEVSVSNPFLTAEITDSPTTLAMNAAMGVVFDKAVEMVSRATVEKTPMVLQQVADRQMLQLDHMTRNKSQGLVLSLNRNRLEVNMLIQQHIDTGDTGYVYIVELVDGVEKAYKIADIQVQQINTNTVTKGLPVAGNVDFRDSPGGNIISMVSPNSSLHILANEGEWQKARYQGQDGYVLTEYLSLQTVQEEIATCRIARAYEVVDTGGWLGIHFGDQ